MTDDCAAGAALAPDYPNCQKDHEPRCKKSSIIERHWASSPSTCFVIYLSKAISPTIGLANSRLRAGADRCLSERAGVTL